MPAQVYPVESRISQGQDKAQGITRVSKACEPCRVRKTRCDIATRRVCSECVKRDRVDECKLRDKARPNRPPPSSHGQSRRRSDKRPRSHSPSSSPVFIQSPTVERTMLTDHSFPSPIPIAQDSERQQQRQQQQQQQQLINPPLNLSHPHPRPPNSTAVVVIECMLEELAETRFGQRLSVAIPPEQVFPFRSSRRLTLRDIGVSPGDPESLNQARRWINLHFVAIHHNTPFLHLSQINHIATRVFAPSSQPSQFQYAHGSGQAGWMNGVKSDELGLLFAVLALGRFREETWDSATGRHRHLHPLDLNMEANSMTIGSSTWDEPLGQSSLVAASPASNQSSLVFRTGTIALTLFQLAQDELEFIEQPSEAAVQALFLLHTFVSNTSMGRRSRDFVARAVMMAHEIGLNRTVPMRLDISTSSGSGSHVHVHPDRKRKENNSALRRAVLYLYVYFSDVYLSALDNHPPLIKKHDFDPNLFDPILRPATPSGMETPTGSSVPDLRAFVDLVCTEGGVLEGLHGSLGGTSFEPEKRGDDQHGPEFSASTYDTKLVERVLHLEMQMDALRDRIGSGAFGIKIDQDKTTDSTTRAMTAARLLREIHFNWCRIALRAPFLNHPLLAHSSLSVCSRAALSLLHCYRHVISAGLLNLPWMQLRRITSAIQIVFIAHWKGEVPTDDAERAIDNALVLLVILGTRWKSSRDVARYIMQLAEKSDLQYHEAVLRTPAEPSSPGLFRTQNAVNTAHHPNSNSADSNILLQLATAALNNANGNSESLDPSSFLSGIQSVDQNDTSASHNIIEDWLSMGLPVDESTWIAGQGDYDLMTNWMNFPGPFE